MKTTLWLMGIALLVGCGSSKSFPQSYAEALCSKNFECCDASELVDKTMATCVSDNQQALEFVVAGINASQAQGRASYDAKQSAACVDSLKALSCDEFKQGGGNMASCMAFVTPKVAQGGACSQPYECTTQNCEGVDTTTDPPTDGMCAAAPVLAALGGSCASSACVPEAYCDPETTTCQALKAAGTACTSDSECVNSCNTTTGTCSCYSGCQVAGATTTRGTLLSLLVLGVGLVVTRARRRRR